MCANFSRVRKKWILLALFAGCAGVLVFIALRKGEARTPGPNWPVSFAHRGASAYAPENTLEAFRLGGESGATGLELDVHMTRDGEIVVIHDDTVDRTTNGTGLVREMTLAELRELDAGYRFTPDRGRTYPYRGRGLRIPTLREVYREFPEAAVNIEIKEDQPGVQESVLRVIRGAGAEDRTLVASHRHDVIRRFRKVSGGDIPTSASRREIAVFYLLSWLRLERLARPAYVALQVPVEHRGLPVVTPRFVEAAHSRGVRVDAWTINDAAEMELLLGLGVDGVMTDRPETLEGVLKERPGWEDRIGNADVTPKGV